MSISPVSGRMADIFLDARHVSKTYPGVQALDKVDFSLKQGEIHCLVGKNGSGKSTLIKILSGVAQPELDAEINILGEKIDTLNARSSIERGIRVIYQDLALFPNLTVKENIAFQGYSEQRSPYVNWKKITEVAKQGLAEIGIDLDLNRQVGLLSIAQQQLVEITRALIGSLKLLILDEPTASLTRKEVNALFEVILRLQSKGITTLFVSHKLNEIFEIAERVTVLRDGKKIGVYNPRHLNQEKLTMLMTGHKVKHKPPPALKQKKILLRVSALNKRDNFADINLHLAKGEILGIIGLLGSGRSELAQSIFGMNRAESGTLEIEGKRVFIQSNTSAIKQGIGYVPENRLAEGIVMHQSVSDNIAITIWNRLLNRFRFIQQNLLDDEVSQWSTKLDIKMSNAHNAIQTLSGGNQQKVVLAKWLATSPKILLLDEPTVGIDVLAKDSIHRLIKSLADEGIGVILISDEIQDALRNCHRVLVMQNGRIVEEFLPSQTRNRDLLTQYNLA